MSDELFDAPEVEVGDIVHFYHGASPGTLSVNPVAAIVTEVHPRGLLDLAIIEKDNYGLKVPESSVRHADDPMAKRSLEIDPDNGVWCLVPGQLTKAEIRELRILLAPSKLVSLFDASPRPKPEPAAA